MLQASFFCNTQQGDSMNRFGKILGLVVGGCLAVLFISGTFLLVKKMYFGSSSARGGHVAVLDLTGIIADSVTFDERVREAVEEDKAKALVIQVNSPGGLVAPSQEIYKTLLKTDEKVPVVISMSSVAASGGYYVALGGRRVWANPGTPHRLYWRHHGVCEHGEAL